MAVERSREPLGQTGVGFFFLVPTLPLATV